MSRWSQLSTLGRGASYALNILFLLQRLFVQFWSKTHLWNSQQCFTDLRGKTAVVTGANSGLGKAVSLELARRGACVILACRSRERGQQALADIQAATKGNSHVLLGEVDMSSMTSIRNFVQWLLREHPEIHLLVNNAAVSGALQRAGSARVVNVSSFRHVRGYFDEEHLTGAGSPLAFHQHYDCSKLLLISFTGELARRLQGTGVTVNSVDPGVVYTEIMKNFSHLYRFIFWLSSFFIKDAKQGIIPILYLSLAKELEGISGRYFNSSCVITLPSEAGQDPHVAQRLWNASVQLTKLDQMG
ncbi:Retinol dehydrogenase 12 [Galemys pyrenaicus]|uniref:Retinol dehydrogenase 12 n=1 Tax=Galemys pyrenaicus TaxID=202257 RepID=A0A8J6AD23_GALPY|nr:Retinol dehydrogenase 12 [Galemys pyrenaicus]